MILQEQGDQLLIIRQTDHALLAGFLAREWGNGLFKRPELFDCFCLAVREHDNGWSEWEQAPQIDPKTRLPYSFISIPTEQHVALYEWGIERILNVDRYAALLVSLHCAGLYDRVRATLPGFSAKYVRSGESTLVSEFVQRLKLQQLRLKTELRMNPVTKNLVEHKSLQKNTRLLEVLDRLSLYFCLQPPDDATIEGVPLDDQGGEVDWELRSHGDNRVSLSTYPFRKDPLPISTGAPGAKALVQRRIGFSPHPGARALFRHEFHAKCGRCVLGPEAKRRNVARQRWARHLNRTVPSQDWPR